MNRAGQSTHYTPSYAVAHVPKVNQLVLGTTTSSCTVMVDGYRINLRLTKNLSLRNSKYEGILPAEIPDGNFSQKVIHLVKGYSTKFPSSSARF